MTTDQPRIDPNDPFYIHPSDHPGTILVTPSFDGKGFGEWRRSIRIALSAKNKVGFINGAIAKPDLSSPRHQYWERCNDMVISWIANSLSPEIRRSVIYNDTAQAIWRQLNSRFSKVGGTQLHSIQHELYTTTQGTSSISAYFTKIKSLWDGVDSVKNLPSCTCGFVSDFTKYEENQRIVQLLMGLNESYLAVRGSILMMDPLPDVDRVYFLLIQEENQREGKSVSGSGISEGVSMHVKSQQAPSASKGSRSGFGTSHGSGSNSGGSYTSVSSSNSGGGHGSSFGKSSDKANSDKGKSERKPLFCTNCKKMNHTVDRCFFIIGFPPGYADNRDKKDSSERRFAGSVGQVQKPDFTNEQIAQLVALLQSTKSSSPRSTEPTADDFAGFSGSFDEEPYEDW